MPRQHVWIERAENGVKREVRATWFGREWRLQAKGADEEKWTYYTAPLSADLVALRELVRRKYRRRRATADELAAIEKLVRQQEGEASSTRA